MIWITSIAEVIRPVTPQQPKKIQYFEDVTELSCRNKKCKGKWFQEIRRYKDNSRCPFCGIEISWPRNTLARTRKRLLGAMLI